LIIKYKDTTIPPTSHSTDIWQVASVCCRLSESSFQCALLFLTLFEVYKSGSMRFEAVWSSLCLCFVFVFAVFFTYLVFYFISSFNSRAYLPACKNERNNTKATTNDHTTKTYSNKRM